MLLRTGNTVPRVLLRAVVLHVLFFVFLLGGALHNLTQASELIGTHLGEGDVGFQVTIIRTILIPNGLEPGSPVTVMVGINMLQDSQMGTVNELAAAVQQGGFFPIVRINDVCDPVDAGSNITPISAVRKVREAFGSDAIIVFGNEVNNQEKECGDWGAYAQGLSQVVSMDKVSPAALDYYMGNPSYTVSEMFSKTSGLSGLFDSARLRAANAYGCIGQTADTCDPVATDTHTVGYPFSTRPLYLTEFSLSPGGSAPDAPDTNLEKVRTFIQTQAPLTGAEKVTPLVRNTCNEEGDWLLYINGNFFTNLGTSVGENCEGGTGAGGWDLAIYPEYNVEDDLFFLSPIRNSQTSGTTERTVEKLRSELASQGYEAYCAAEGVTIKAEYKTAELIEKYLDYYKSGIINVNPSKIVESSAFLSATNARYPIWRNVSGKQHMFASLEEYFGFKDVYEPDPALSVIKSGPINTLLSQKQMCVQGWKNIVAQKQMCERLDESQWPQCALLGRTIPPADASITVDKTYELMKEFGDKYSLPVNDGVDIIACEKLFSADTVLSQNDKLLKETIVNVPTYFDRAYRYGFIVAAVQTQSPGTAQGTLADKIFNIFTKTTRGGVPRDEVLVAAFKLPDIGTNKGGGDDSGSQFWNDPTDLTRQVLSTKQAQYKHESSIDPDDNFISRPEKRSITLIDAAREAKQTPNSRIYCYEGEFGTGTGTTSCQNEMTKAIVDIVNGGADGCGDTEAAQLILDSAGLGDPTHEVGKLFNDDNGGKVLENLFKLDRTHETAGSAVYDPRKAKNPDDDPFVSLFDDIHSGIWPPSQGETKVSYYIVYPKGYELKAVEESIQGTFFSVEQMKELARAEAENEKDGFALTGVAAGLSGGSTGWEFPDPKKPVGSCGYDQDYDPETGDPIGTPRPKPCMDEVSIEVKQEGSIGAGVFGATLGRTLRNVQLALNTKAGETAKYIKSCKTMEQFLLGRCSGGVFSGGGAGGETPNSPDLTAVAICPDPPVARIGSGSGADHVTVSNPTGQCVGRLTRKFVESQHDIPEWKNPNDRPRSCDRMYEYVACNTEYKNTLIQNKVIEIGQGTAFSVNGTETACEYVVRRASELGISPRFALAMWGEESGFSAYRTYDFGVISQPKQNIEMQLRLFANTAKGHDTYFEFLEAYAGEERGTNQFCVNPNFVARLRKFYDYLEP